MLSQLMELNVFKYTDGRKRGAVTCLNKLAPDRLLLTTAVVCKHTE